MHAQRRVARRGVVHGAPPVDAPMHDGRRERLDAERPVRRHRAHLVVEAPDDAVRRRLLDEVPLDRLRRPIEDAAVEQRPAQLEILGVRPDERHGRTGGVADEQLAIRNVGAVPHLFGKEAARRPPSSPSPARDARRRAAGRRRARSGRARPSAAATRGRRPFRRTGSVGVLAVSVALIPMPGRPARRFHFQRGIDDFDGVQRCADRRGARSPKRTNASASRLTISAAGPVA